MDSEKHPVMLDKLAVEYVGMDSVKSRDHVRD